jgi:hypothetical protein
MCSTSLFARPMLGAVCVVGFALALSLGCGTNMHDQKAAFGTSFTPPALNTIDPNTVPVNSTPFVMTLNGHNFGPDAIVFWNKVPHMARFVSSTELQVSVTADDLTIFGLVQVYVQTAGMTSNTVDFELTAN